MGINWRYHKERLLSVITCKLTNPSPWQDRKIGARQGSCRLCSCSQRLYFVVVRRHGERPVVQ